jgi:hypothetical protein
MKKQRENNLLQKEQKLASLKHSNKLLENESMKLEKEKESKETLLRLYNALLKKYERDLKENSDKKQQAVLNQLVDVFNEWETEIFKELKFNIDNLNTRADDFEETKKFQLKQCDIARKSLKTYVDSVLSTAPKYISSLNTICKKANELLVNGERKVDSIETELLRLNKGRKYTCGICFEEYFIEDIDITCDKHPYCRSCMRNCFKSAVIDKTQIPVRCFGCIQEKLNVLPEYTAEFYLEGEDLTTYESTRTKLYAFPDQSKIIYCPNPTCSEIYYSEDIIDPIQRNSECYSCHKMFCTSCRVPWHADLACEQFQALPEDMRTAEDRASLQFMNRTFKRCPGCRFFVEKVAGCNHMNCTICRQRFCYNCGDSFPCTCGQDPHVRMRRF